MPKKTPGKPLIIKVEKPEFKSYVNFNLLESHKAAIRKREITFSHVADCLAEILLHGYRLTITPDLNEDVYNCSVMGWSAQNPNRGYVMNFRHTDHLMPIVIHQFVNSEIYQWGEWDTLNGIDPNLNW